jgi:purine nucleosidase
VAPLVASRNVQAIVAHLDPPRHPRVGIAATDRLLRVDAAHLHGPDGLCGAHFPVAELHHRHPSTKVINDEVRASAEPLTIIATGPLSNIATALQQQPELASLVGHLVILGGTVSGPGNVTPAAEFNIYCDAEAARAVFQSPVTKTLIPIDVSRRIVLGYDCLERLPSETTKTGDFLRRILPGAFRAYRQQMGIEGIYVHDAVAVVAAMHPELFTTERMYGDVELDGTLTHGATVFDRRHRPDYPPNMDVAVDVDADAVTDCIYRTLAAAS